MNSYLHDELGYARTLARLFHDGQFDKAGLPYIEHVLRVSNAGATTEEKIVGALHDILEDTPMKAESLRAIFGDTIADAVEALTRQPLEEYMLYVARAADNPIARQVKKYDLNDNLGRLSQLPASQAHSLWRRYTRALLFLDELDD
jgi:(p)ppGpp synthase/HD superfamily hydrolase